MVLLGLLCRRYAVFLAASLRCMGNDQRGDAGGCGDTVKWFCRYCFDERNGVIRFVALAGTNKQLVGKQDFNTFYIHRAPSHTFHLVSHFTCDNSFCFVFQFILFRISWANRSFVIWLTVLLNGWLWIRLRIVFSYFGFASLYLTVMCVCGAVNCQISGANMTRRSLLNTPPSEMLAYLLNARAQHKCTNNKHV